VDARVARLLGKMGGAAHALVDANTPEGKNAHDDSNESLWDPRAVVSLELSVGGGVNGSAVRLKLWLDAMLPRAAALALTSPDRASKVAAAEFLHAATLLMVGTNARAAAPKGGDYAREPTRFHHVYRRLFPVVIELAVDPEPVTRMLFSSLAYQLARWFTRNQAREAAETVALLDAITEGPGGSDVKRRWRHGFRENLGGHRAEAGALREARRRVPEVEREAPAGGCRRGGAGRGARGARGAAPRSTSSPSSAGSSPFRPTRTPGRGSARPSPYRGASASSDSFLSSWRLTRLRFWRRRSGRSAYARATRRGPAPRRRARFCAARRCARARGTRARCVERPRPPPPEGEAGSKHYPGSSSGFSRGEPRGSRPAPGSSRNSRSRRWCRGCRGTRPRAVASGCRGYRGRTFVAVSSNGRAARRRSRARE
jgi:hypothetical protein